MKILIPVLFVVAATATAQSVSKNLPEKINADQRFLFYLHGGVVTYLGDNAVNESVPEWGPYEYSKILDSLKNRRFQIVSEIRKEGIDDSMYVAKIVRQINTLLRAGVPGRNILLVGASAGASIALRVSSQVAERNIRYVILGACWPDTHKKYISIELSGHFLSIIEASDPHGTCSSIFENRKRIGSYTEITLNTGLSHGFLYKGHKEWIDPIVTWFNKK